MLITVWLSLGKVGSDCTSPHSGLACEKLTFVTCASNRCSCFAGAVTLTPNHGCICPAGKIRNSQRNGCVPGQLDFSLIILLYYYSFYIRSRRWLSWWERRSFSVQVLKVVGSNPTAVHCLLGRLVSPEGCSDLPANREHPGADIVA